MNLSASIDPHYTKDFEVTDQYVTWRDDTKEALATVRFDRLTIQSCDADAMRRLAAALTEAAERIDRLNEETRGTGRSCVNCGDTADTLSSRDWCDGCEAAEARVLTA